VKSLLKHLSFIALAALVLTNITSAQDTKTKSSAGDFGLMFDLGGLADLALNGIGGGDTTVGGLGAFGAKYYFANNVAGRLILGFTSESIEGGVGSTGIVVAPGVLVNLASRGPVAGYIGGQLQFYHNSFDLDSLNGLPFANTTTLTSFAVEAVIGAEWFPWSNLSLSGEYGLSYSTTSTSSETTLPNGDKQSLDLPTASLVTLTGRGRILATIYW